MYPEPSPQDKAIARRRVTSAICAFGGTQTAESQQSSSSGQSIFREKEETPTVTPSSSGAPSGARFQSRAKANYNDVLPTRYYENENRLSWEFEENPAVVAEIRAKILQLKHITSGVPEAVEEAVAAPEEE